MANDIKLQEGHPVDENLRPIKVGGKSTALETAQHGSGARVNGDLEVTGDIKGNIKDMVLDDLVVDSLTTTGDITCDDITCDALAATSIGNFASTNLTIDDSGDITLDAVGGEVNVLQADLKIPIDKKVIFGGDSEYITGDDTDLLIKAQGDILVVPGTDAPSLKVQSAAGQERIQLNTSEGGTGASIKLHAILDNDDYCLMKTTTNGATTISTVDDDAALASLTLDVDGKITLDSATGEFEMKGAGTVPKFADMYAGMILGYTRIQNDSVSIGDNLITIGTTMTVLETSQGTECKVTFVAPPSECVEIQFSCQQIAGRFAYYSLSSAASYAEVDETHTYDDTGVIHDETDAGLTNISFSITSGLTAGTSYTRWIAAKSNSSTFNIQHGRAVSTGTHDPPIIIKAIALPATIVTGE